MMISLLLSGRPTPKEARGDQIGATRRCCWRIVMHAAALTYVGLVIAMPHLFSSIGFEAARQPHRWSWNLSRAATT